MKFDRLSALLFSIFTMAFTGCVHHWPEEKVGQRENAQGEVIQQITRVSTSTDYPAITPDGRNSRTTIRNKYFLSEKGGPKRKFWDGDGYTDPFLGGCLPVTNTDLWISYSDKIVWTNRQNMAHQVTDYRGKVYTSYTANDLHVYVFDAKGLFLERMFAVIQSGEGISIENTNFPKFPNNTKIEIQNGNRIISFHSIEGFKQYDAVTDKVTTLGKN